MGYSYREDVENRVQEAIEHDVSALEMLDLAATIAAGSKIGELIDRATKKLRDGGHNA